MLPEHKPYIHMTYPLLPILVLEPQGITDISILLPNLLSLDPGTENLALAVEHDQVSVCTGPERTLLVLDPEASRKGACMSAFAHKVRRPNVHLAGFKVAHLIASPSEQPVNFTKLRTHLSRVTTLREIIGIDEQTTSTGRWGRNGPPSERCSTF